MIKSKTTNLVTVAVFAAIIIIMAFTPMLGYIPLGAIRITIIHIPVIIGSIILGPKYGAVLGGVFGMTSLVNNTVAPVLTSFVFTPFYSIGGVGGNFWSLVICFVPRILVGVIPFFVFKACMKIFKNNKKGEIGALVVSGLAGSLTNTILVMNMIYIFFGDSYAQATNNTIDALYGVILGIIAVNGVPEAIGAAVLTAAIGKILLRIKNN